MENEKLLGIEKSLIRGRKIRIAIIGCGRISKSHFAAIATHKDDMELSAVCDVDTDILNEHVKKYGVNGYKSLEDLPRGMQIDTTTTAYGKAVPQGTPVPQFSNGGECRGAGAAVKGKKFQGVF